MVIVAEGSLADLPATRRLLPAVVIDAGQHGSRGRIIDTLMGDEHHRACLRMLRCEDIKKRPGLIVAVIDPSRKTYGSIVHSTERGHNRYSLGASGLPRLRRCTFRIFSRKTAHRSMAHHTILPAGLWQALACVNGGRTAEGNREATLVGIWTMDTRCWSSRVSSVRAVLQHTPFTEELVSPALWDHCRGLPLRVYAMEYGGYTPAHTPSLGMGTHRGCHCERCRGYGRRPAIRFTSSAGWSTGLHAALGWDGLWSSGCPPVDRHTSIGYSADVYEAW